MRGVVPHSGASKARLVNDVSPRHPSTEQGSALRPGDRLLAVDGESVIGLSQEAAAQMVSSAGHEVQLTVVRNPDIHDALVHGTNTKSADRTVTRGSSFELSSKCPECQLCVSFIETPFMLTTHEDSGMDKQPVSTRPHSVSYYLFFTVLFSCIGVCVTLRADKRL